MKKLFFITLVTAAMMSCREERNTVRFTNGAYVSARNFTQVEYGNGSKVCLVNVNGRGWTFCSDGDLKDTVYVVTRHIEGKPQVNTVRHRVGTIVER